jgi:hypothetical protein
LSTIAVDVVTVAVIFVVSVVVAIIVNSHCSVEIRNKAGFGVQDAVDVIFIVYLCIGTC